MPPLPRNHDDRRKPNRPNRPNWRSYDQIAHVYDRIWASRFETVARGMASMMPSAFAPRTLLDIGTGTGIVAAIFSESFKTLSVLAGCDLSLGMVEQARARLARLQVVVADAIDLPFKSATFDLATAGFVLSHLREYRRALNNIHRVLRSSGLAAASNWTSTVDEYSQEWSACLAEAITKPEAERALQEVAPMENYFSEEGNLQAAMTECGFSVVQAGAVDLRLELTVEQYVEDREINSGGRLGRHLLGNGEWMKFRQRASNILRDRFGDTIHYSRQALVVIGQKSE